MLGAHTLRLYILLSGLILSGARLCCILLSLVLVVCLHLVVCSYFAAFQQDLVSDLLCNISSL